MQEEPNHPSTAYALAATAAFMRGAGAFIRPDVLEALSAIPTFPRRTNKCRYRIVDYAPPIPPTGSPNREFRDKKRKSR